MSPGRICLVERLNPDGQKKVRMREKPKMRGENRKRTKSKKLGFLYLHRSSHHKDSGFDVGRDTLWKISSTSVFAASPYNGSSQKS